MNTQVPVMFHCKWWLITWIGPRTVLFSRTIKCSFLICTDVIICKFAINQIYKSYCFEIIMNSSSLIVPSSSCTDITRQGLKIKLFDLSIVFKILEMNVDLITTKGIKYIFIVNSKLLLLFVIVINRNTQVGKNKP